MRKVLLTSALAVMTLAAGAQTEVARPAGKFEFVPKNLTVDGKPIPTSMVQDDENGNYEFTIYDSSFNKERSFSLPIKKYTYTQTQLEAQAPISKSTVLDKDIYRSYEVSWYDYTTGDTLSISTFDDWKAYVSERYGAQMVVFTDAEGNFAYHESNDYWSRLEGTQDDGVVLRQVYYYYDKSTKSVVYCSAKLLCQVNTDNLSWTKVSSSEGGYTSSLAYTCLTDYDANYNGDPYLTQGLFNNDDKFEAVMTAYKETSAENYDDGTGLGYGKFSIVGASGDSVTLRKYEQDKYYESYVSVVNEDGQEVVALPETSYELGLNKVDGKLYMTVSAYENGEEQTIIYSVDSTNTSITELTRTKAVKSAKTFNLAGMQVDKNAKGVVIQQGGKKYINQ